MPKDFAELLQALQGPLAVAAFAWVAAWGLEDFAFWQGLGSKAKSLLVLVFSIALGVGAVWFAGHPEWVAAADPYIKAVLAISGAWLSTQVAHRKDAKVEYFRDVRETEAWEARIAAKEAIAQALAQEPKE